MLANIGFEKFRSSVVAAAAWTMLCSSSYAGPVSWLGNSGYWHDAAHWSGFARPGPDDDVVLAWPYAVGATVYLGSGYSAAYGPAQIGSLTIGAWNRVQIDAETLQVGGGIVNDGEIILNNSYNAPSTLKIGVNAALVGTGTLTMKYGSALDLNTRTLTIGGAQTVRGAGAIGNGNLINQGQLIADGQLDFYPGANFVDNSSGRISIGAKGTLSANQTSFTGGQIATATGGVIGGSGSPSKAAVFSAVTFSGDARLVGEVKLVNATNQGVLRIDNASWRTSVQGALHNDGNVYVDGTLAVQGDAVLTGGGTVWIRRSNFPYPGASIGTLDVATNTMLTIDSAQTVRGAGRIRAAADARIVNNGTLIAEGGSLYLYAGDGAFDNSAGRITVAHDAVVGTAGTLVMGDASILTFDVGNSAADHGMLYLLSGTPQVLDGTLKLNIGYGAHVGDSFSLMQAGAGGLTGSFDQIFAAGYTLNTTYSTSDLTVTITGISAVPEPSGWLLACAGWAVIGRRIRKQRSTA